jgi:hypothetical protein
LVIEEGILIFGAYFAFRIQDYLTNLAFLELHQYSDAYIISKSLIIKYLGPMVCPFQRL